MAEPLRAKAVATLEAQARRDAEALAKMEERRAYAREGSARPAVTFPLQSAPRPGGREFDVCELMSSRPGYRLVRGFNLVRQEGS